MTMRERTNNVYISLRTMDKMNNTNLEMRIKKLWPQAGWEMIWENLRFAPVPGTVIATWYKVIHDIIPTKTLALQDPHVEH